MNLTVAVPDARTVFVARVPPDAVFGDIAKRASRDTLARMATRMRGAEVRFWPRADDAFFAEGVVLNPHQWPVREEPRLRLVA